MKYSAPHPTTICSLKKDEKPKCVNCRGQHPASYIGCPIAKEQQERRKKLINTHQQGQNRASTTTTTTNRSNNVNLNNNLAVKIQLQTINRILKLSEIQEKKKILYQKIS